MADELRSSKLRPALLRCVELSVAFQWSTEASRGCWDALDRHFPERHVRIDELRPSLSTTAPPATAAPLAYDSVRRPRPHRPYASAGSTLYVNRGLGTSMLPVRAFCRPELAVATLR